MTPSLTEATGVFLRIGLLSFGGPAAQIALMHRALVEERGWLSDREFLNALSFCMLLPGPEAMQLATYCGWRLHGTWGGLIAGLLFVIPGALIILGLAFAYVYLGALPLVAALFLGVKATVVVIVLEALLKVSRKALTGPEYWAIAGLSFVGIFALALPFPLIIALAALWGLMRGGGPAEPVPPAPQANTARTVALGLAIWLLPLGLLAGVEGALLMDLAVFFSKLAIVTFGGAYAVLAYMTQEVVSAHGWLTTAEMMDGLGLAETTPGPLILVTEFVGFVAGFRAAGPGTAMLAALVTLWMTFAPCFLWIFAGAPYIERLTARPRLRAALTAITAAVVGVILNLSLWFAAHVFFSNVGHLDLGPLQLIRPDLSSFDWRAGLLALGAGILLLKFHRPLPLTLALAALAGMALAPLG